jgi:hypothetical protein
MPKGVVAAENQDKDIVLLENLFGLELNDSWTVPEDKMSVACMHRFY